MVWWHSVKIWLYYKLIEKIKHHKKFKKASIFLALFLGTIIYKLASKFFDIILCKLKGMRTLSSFDNFFLSDDKKCIISGGFRFTSNFDFETLSDLWKTRFLKNYPGAACRLV